MAQSRPPHKICPQCGQPAVPQMPTCRRCGHVYFRYDEPRPNVLGILFVVIGLLLAVYGTLHGFWTNGRLDTTLTFGSVVAGLLLMGIGAFFSVRK